MRSFFRARLGNTRAQRLIRILRNDKKWHATDELVRRVSHTFGGAKFHLVRRGYVILCRPHPTKRNLHQYRLLAEPPERDED